MTAKRKASAKREMKPIRFKVLRVDSSIAKAQETIENRLGLPSGSVRLVNPNGRKARASTTKTADMLAFEKRVSDATGLVVSIDHHDDHGTLSIRYCSLEQLDDLVQKLVRKH